MMPPAVLLLLLLGGGLAVAAMARKEDEEKKRLIESREPLRLQRPEVTVEEIEVSDEKFPGPWSGAFDGFLQELEGEVPEDVKA